MTPTAAAVQRFLDGLNAHDPDAVVSCVTVDFVNEHTSTLGTTRVGRAAYRQALPDFFARFADLHYETEDMIVDGDRAAVAYRMTFTWTADRRQLHPVAIRGMFRFVVTEGLVARRVDYWDSAEFERQVGLR